MFSAGAIINGKSKCFGMTKANSSKEGDAKPAGLNPAFSLSSLEGRQRRPTGLTRGDSETFAGHVGRVAVSSLRGLPFWHVLSYNAFVNDDVVGDHPPLILFTRRPLRKG